MTDRTPDPSLISYTHIIYALHALSVVIALTSAAWYHYLSNNVGSVNRDTYSKSVGASVRCLRD